MAKKFGGFTPQQQQTLLSKVGYTGPAQQDDINKFMMSSPKAASMMGQYAEMAKARVQGGPQTAMQVGGYMAPPMSMQQQPMTPLLDYNRLYAQPNMQPMQQPIAMQTGGIATIGEGNNQYFKVGGSTFQDYGSALNHYNTSGGAAKFGSLQNTTTPNTTGGFDMGVDTPVKMPGGPALPLPIGPITGKVIDPDTGRPPETGGPALPLPIDPIRPPLPPEPEPDLGGYDPSQGLPTAPEKIDTGEILQDLNWAKHSQKGIDMLLESGKLPSDEMFIKTTNPDGTESLTPDPSKYTVSGGRENWIFTFEDGTSTVVNRAELSKAKQTLANEITPVISKLKQSGWEEKTKAAQDTYNKQLDQYKSYYGQQATVSPEQTRANLDTAQSGLSKEQNLLQSYTTQLSNMAADDPQRATIQGLIDEQQVKVTNAKANLSQAQTNLERVGMPSTTEMRADILDDPIASGMVTEADVVTVSPEQRAAGKIVEGTGQAAAVADTATQTEAAIAADVPLAEEFDAAGFTAKEAAAEVANVMSKLTAVTGKPSAEALAEAATMDPSQLAQLGLTVEQIERAQRVEKVAPLEVTPEMRVDSAVDFERARAETNFTAATGVPSTEATVQGQLTGLLEQFEGGETPAWAAGAMRTATATLAARGLGASSMAGQAIVQAAMESALPIAQMDAQTRASFEAQNLSNRQQAAMFAAEQRSKFLGMEFDQEFQSRVQNAARIADVAQINFTAEQQVALENARMAQTVDISNLDAKNAKVLADAAAMTQLDLTNLSNRQQANVDRAKAFLNFDMSSMNNQQQVAMFKAQSLASVFMSDTAAENARRQFNASSSNQVDMFFSNLQTQIQQSNVDQRNAMERFNAGEANAISQFNSAQQNARDQFNANNALVVAQANTQWEQAITTMDNAAQNQANRDAAQQANNLTETTYNNMLQQERDALDYAVRIADREDQQEHALTLEGISNDAAASAASGSAVGTVIATASTLLLKKAIGVQDKTWHSLRQNYLQ